MQPKVQGGTLVHSTKQALSARILGGEFALGARLPSEARLCEEYGVSRTVIREAIASLRADGLVEPRRGAGVFVVKDTLDSGLPFTDVDYDRVSSVIEVLELRTAIEIESARIAATRRSAAQIERILEAADDVPRRARDGQATAEADFAFHLAIAEATGNPRFVEVLTMLGAAAIPRKALRPATEHRSLDSYLTLIDEEHRQIVDAILDQDPDAAGVAMRRHLEGAQKRYRKLLRRA
ncbi:FadR/GntR family transcriptional regulator [Tropicibacter oceani]|uniref:FadR/GntR family transcriptional regulator n=1 Tax=Tropicibacter oceani TaxID=3058420 RepID=A0ABY8QEX0_9RHOB|nr:FadR/GntR family transcriptional regulator [Tropicibacter oceani]WGW02998.1 FadR/GntR family transcriptional regulator [Tropicibacter oceani]